MIVTIEKLRGRNVDLLNDLDPEADLVDVIDRMRGHSSAAATLEAMRGHTRFFRADGCWSDLRSLEGRIVCYPSSAADP